MEIDPIKEFKEANPSPIHRYDWDKFKEEQIMSQQKLKVIATIHSFSEIEKKYVLKQDDEGHVKCNCPSWIFNQRGDRTCKHTDVIGNHADNLEKLIAFSGRYKVEIENDGDKWIIEKKDPNGNDL